MKSSAWQVIEGLVDMKVFAGNSRLYDTYVSCSRPFLEDCNHETLTEMHFLGSVFQPLCGEYLKAYLGHNDCYRKLDNSYDSCQRKRQKQLGKTTADSILYRSILCDATNEYVLCLFTATSLGCSIEAAKIYTDLVNQTLATLLANTGYSCHIANPLDVIKLLTTTTSTTTATTTISHMSRGPHGFLTTTLTNAYEAHNTGARYSPFKIVIIVLVVQRWLKVYFTLSRT
ncbi:hypothetical protein ScPMuIL_016646 [Solemya velum]